MGNPLRPPAALTLVLCLGLIAPSLAAGPHANAAEAPAFQPQARDALPRDATATFAALASGGGPRHGQAEDDDASASCLPVVQDGFRWVSAAVMANGLPILAYLSRRSYVSGGKPDEDGYLHPRIATYLSETAIAAPIVLEDPMIVGRANGYDNESSVDVATNGPGGLILATFIDPVRFRFVVRRSTDLGRTWSPIQPIPGLGTADPYSGNGALHHLYYDDQSQLFFLSFPYGYVTTADGIAWSSLRSWGTFTASAPSNPGQSRKVHSFRTKNGTWLRYGNLFNSTAGMNVARFGNGVCDTLACWPSQQTLLWNWDGIADTTPPTQEQRSMLHTPGSAFYMPSSSTADRIHLLFGATGLTGFRSTPRGHLFHWWSDDDGRTWSNENGVAGGQGNDTSLAGAADVETPVPEPATGPLADISAAWVPSFGSEGRLVVWGVEGNNANNAPGLSFSVFANGERDQTRVQGLGGYTTCSKKRSFLWVHGIRGSFRDQTAFAAVLGPLREKYGNERVRNFEYLQDAGYQQNGRCVDMPPHRVPDDAGGLPLTLGASSIDSNACDSQSDVGLNAILVDDAVRALHEEFGGPVTLIANSMGGAITRAFLAYSVAAGTGTHELVDNVYFLQVAQQGSHLAYPPAVLSGLRDSRTPLDRVLGEAISAAARALTGWDPTRPAAGDLRPRSETYAFVNPPSAHVPDQVGYFNVASDIRWTLELSVFNVPFRRLIGATSTLGDYVILPGTDTPTDLPVLGGARFDPGTIGRGRDSHQWVLRRDHVVRVTSLVTLLRPIGPFPGDFSFPGDPFAVPESHLQLGGTGSDGTPRMREVYATDRMTGDRQSLDVLILREIERQDPQ